jgi:hypothetical protein
VRVEIGKKFVSVINLDYSPLVASGFESINKKTPVIGVIVGDKEIHLITLEFK